MAGTVIIICDLCDYPAKGPLGLATHRSRSHGIKSESKHAIAMRELRDRRMALGICVACGDPELETMRLCAHCAEYLRVRAIPAVIARRARLIAAGLCPTCTNPARPGCQLCQACADVAFRWQHDNPERHRELAQAGHHRRSIAVTGRACLGGCKRTDAQTNWSKRPAYCQGCDRRGDRNGICQRNGCRGALYADGCPVCKEKENTCSESN